jgi:hypothetical protein
MKLAYALGRPAVRVASSLRGRFRRISATRNRHLPLTPELVESSIQSSLRKLRTDHVDIYALHDPCVGDVLRDDIIRALERVLARGQARRIAVAGTAAACQAALAVGEPYELLQMSVADFERHRVEFTRAAPPVVLHSVFGVEGTRDGLLASLARHPERALRLAELGYDRNPKRAASQLLLDNAFALNPGGAVLASMFAPAHLTTNLTRAHIAARSDAPALLRDMLA